MLSNTACSGLIEGTLQSKSRRGSALRFAQSRKSADTFGGVARRPCANKGQLRHGAALREIQSGNHQIIAINIRLTQQEK
jgi:hypothetical protein